MFVGGFVCQLGVMLSVGLSVSWGLCCQWVCLSVGSYVCYWVCLSVGVMFGIGFVCLWVGKYVIMPFSSREGASVGLFN